MDTVIKFGVVALMLWAIWTHVLGGDLSAVTGALQTTVRSMPTATVAKPAARPVPVAQPARVITTAQSTPRLLELEVVTPVPTTNGVVDTELYEGCGEEFYSCEDMTAQALEAQATTQAWIAATPVITAEFTAEMVAYCKTTSVPDRTPLMAEICRAANL